jgi:hypothetical protein
MDMRLVEKIVERLLEYGDKNRFQYYRELTARRAGPADCRPGHTIKVGDTIGWNSYVKKSQCKDCWSHWKAENAEADAYERQYGGYGGYGSDY